LDGVHDSGGNLQNASAALHKKSLPLWLLRIHVERRYSQHHKTPPHCGQQPINYTGSSIGNSCHGGV
jgi:hypothetical protein